MEINEINVEFENDFKITIKHKGNHYKLPNIWQNISNDTINLKLENFFNIPIKYCEIGVFYAVNFIVVEKTYASHPQSELIAIDPWLEYDDYPEYKDKNMNSIYEDAIENMKMNNVNMNKVKIMRDFSHKTCNLLQDDYFDLIYVDGNHEKHAVLEDMILYFRKLKSGGIMILDDAHHENILIALSCFIKTYNSKLYDPVYLYEGQAFLKKK